MKQTLLLVRATLVTKPQPKDTQGDKGQYENNVQLMQWISSGYTSANDKYMETRLVQWISSEIKLRRSHHTGRNPKPYTGTYYIIRTNKGKGNINENPDTPAECNTVIFVIHCIYHHHVHCINFTLMAFITARTLSTQRLHIVILWYIHTRRTAIHYDMLALLVFFHVQVLHQQAKWYIHPTSANAFSLGSVVWK